MKVPSAGTPIGVKDLLRAFFNPPSPPFVSPLSKGGDRGVRVETGGFSMEEALKSILDVKHCFLVNSGTTAFYVILKALLQTLNSELRTPKNEVILPAYTAPSLVLPIKRLGLSYRLVDVSLETFNMDEEALIRSLNHNTLAVLPVHLFGLPSPIEKMLSLKNEIGFYVIEDSASSFGTKDGKFHSGTRGDVGFLSFNRGKNISTVRGGAIITNDDRLAIEFKKEVEALPEPDFKSRMRIYLEGIGLSLAVRPWFYTLFYPLVSRFKKTSLHGDFESYRYTPFQGALGLSIFERAEQIFHGREDKGIYLYKALKGISGIRLPFISDEWRVAFNQFPVVVDDPLKRDVLVERILKAGVEVTTLYDEPIHQIYNTHQPPLNLRWGKGELRGADLFPNATYMARRLLLIPTHPFIHEIHLSRVVEIIRSELSK